MESIFEETKYKIINNKLFYCRRLNIDLISDKNFFFS